MRLIPSYPSLGQCAAYISLSSNDLSCLVTSEFLHVITPGIITSQSTSPSSPTARPDWDSMFGQQLALSCQLWVPLVCCDLHQLHPIWIYNYHHWHCHPAAQIIHRGIQTAHNENLHISPFWVITVFMYFRDKKFYGCRHHLVQLVLSVNSHNHFPSRLYPRSSCQVSALFSSQEFQQSPHRLKRCNNNPSLLSLVFSFWSS